MGSRPIVQTFDNSNLSIDAGSKRSLDSAVDGNNFTACMDLTTKIMYFAPLAPSPVAGENHYATVPPSFQCSVGGAVIAPLVHSNQGGKTGHQQVAEFVLSTLGVALTAANEERFCGFALRFEAPSAIAFAATSRHLNPGENGQLEPAILDAVFNYLTAELGKIPISRTLAKAAARTSPAAVAARIGGAAVATNRMAMLGGLKQSFATKKTI
jgi:hypothetical protein